MENEAQVEIQSAVDIVTARQKGRMLAMGMGFSGSDLTMIATAISEIARNIVAHAKRGVIKFNFVRHNSRPGLQIVARDEGPGIRDIPQAMQYGYSSSQGLGVGLPGAKRLMDEFQIDSKPGKGTVITMKKWLR
jgi:serine/threonine-protein kinase RsbT